MDYVICGGELYHHGVKGMKWGVRRAKKRAERADRKIRKIETARDLNKTIYKEMQADSRDMYSSQKKSKKLAKSLASDKAIYDTSEVTNRYMIARQKAKKDKNYKNSAEYMRAKAAYRKQNAQQYVYGAHGHQRIETLKNLGYSEKRAKGKTAVENIALAAGLTLASLGVSALLNKAVS